MTRKLQPPATTPTRTRTSLWDRLARHILLKQFGKLEQGQLAIETADGAPLGRPAASDQTPRVRVLSPDCYRQVLLRGTTGAAEAYILGHWDTDDLRTVIETVLANHHVYAGLNGGLTWFSERSEKLMHRLNRNTPYGSLQNIMAHYDLGNDFFATFLDPTMAYSSGIFETETSTLHEASIAKFDRICRKLHLNADDHLIEIGTGWGGLAIHAATHYGCSVTTTTISPEQFGYASRQVTAAGLEGRIELLQQDYRDLTGTYSKLVSVEMIEAVGYDYLDTYLQKCASLLAPDGIMALQAITVPDADYEQHKQAGSFINKYIFPGSNLLSLRCICDSVAADTDLHLANIEDITPHYARTLHQWELAFSDHADEIKAQGKSGAFMRMWRFYLIFCEAAFRSRHTGVAQLLFAKPDCQHKLLPLAPISRRRPAKADDPAPPQSPPVMIRQSPQKSAPADQRR